MSPQAAYMTRYRKARVDCLLCLDCGAKLDGEAGRCPKCLELNRLRVAKHRAVRRLKQATLPPQTH